MSEAVLQGARDIIGLRRVQLERELHELSTRQAQLLHRQERGYRDASGRSGSIVVPGFPGSKVHQEYPGAKNTDETPGFDGDQGRQGPDRVPGNLWTTGDDGLQGVRGDVEPKGFPEPTGRDGRKGISEEQGNTSSQRFPDSESCCGLDGADKVPDTGFSKRHVPPGFDGRQSDTGFSKSDGPLDSMDNELILGSRKVMVPLDSMDYKEIPVCLVSLEVRAAPEFKVEATSKLTHVNIDSLALMQLLEKLVVLMLEYLMEKMADQDVHVKLVILERMNVLPQHASKDSA